MLRRIPSPAEIRQSPRNLPDVVGQSLASARELYSMGAFVSLLDKRAHQQALSVMARLERGEDLPLAGFILAVKDNIAIKDEALTCGSKILSSHPATFTATAVERLESAGAVIMGKTNLDEFAMGSSTENSALAVALNPYNPERVPGGSSGGSAIAVATGVCHASLGSETGGSVRQPASFCGVCGLKPTYGRVSRYGLVAFGSSLDQISPFALTCSDLYDVFAVIAGGDIRDATSSSKPRPVSKRISSHEGKLKIGLVRDFIDHEALEPDVRTAMSEAMASLSDAGNVLVDIKLPNVGFSIPVYYIVATAEASSNLARFDGVRYGFRSSNVSDLSSVFDLTRDYGFGSEVRRRIMMGTYVLSSGYYDAYYKTALKVRRIIADELLAALDEVDVLLTPTTPSTAFKIGEKLDDPIAMYLSDVFTVPANLAGIPALTVPWRNDSSGLPIGIQLMSRHYSEEKLLSIGALIEKLRHLA